MKGVKCKVNFTLGVVNKKELAKSIRRGNLTEEDAFTKAGCGVGWGKLAVAKRLLNDRDFVNDDSLCVELQCRLAETTFEHKFACALKPGDKFIKSSQFSLCNSRWSIILFPQGLPAKKGAAPQHDHVAAYLHCEDVGLLRYKVVFSFHARSKQAKQREISYNFFDECHASCNSFGIEQFMPSKDLKKVAKNGKIKIRLKIKSIESYFYLGIDPVHLKDAEGEGCTRGDLMDQCNNPLGLSLQSSQDGRVVFKMKFDPNGENVALDEMPYFKKIYWRAVVNSFVDDSKTVVVSSSEEAGKSSFCYSEAECSITSKLEMSEIEDKNSVYLDDDGLLSVHLFIDDANLVYDPLLDPLTKQSVSRLREEKEQRLKHLEKECENFIENAVAEKDDIITEQEELLEERDSVINKQGDHIVGLTSEMEENDKYLDEIVDGKGEDATSKLLKRSLRQLIRNAKPSKDEIKALKSVEKKLRKFLKKKLPFSITRVSPVGAFGHETTFKGETECHLAIAIRDLPRTEHNSWLPTIVSTVETLLKTRDKSDTSLPLCTDFVTTESAVNFKCADVNVVLLPINDWESHGGFEALYQLSIKQNADVQMHYNNSVSELQAAFISNQDEKCKDLIRVVKKWSNGVEWSSGSKPTGYLLSLLVVQAYRVVQPEMCENSSTDVDVLLEMKEMVDDENLEVSWDTDNYIAAQYQRKFFPKDFTLPIVQDPAIPTHNVAESEMEDWTEFRKEFSEWVISLSS